MKIAALIAGLILLFVGLFMLFAWILATAAGNTIRDAASKITDKH